MCAMMLIPLMIMIMRHHTKISSPTWSMTMEACQLLSHGQEHKSLSMTLLSQSVVSLIDGQVPREVRNIHNVSSEPITVGYDPDTYVTTESDGNVTLTIRVFSHPGGAPRPFTFVANTEDGIASKCCNFLSEDISSLSLLAQLF